MTLLTDKQREEVMEAMARTVFLRRNGMATCWAWDEGGLDDEHPGAREQYLADAQAALTAALPAIERAVLERARRRTVDEADTVIESLREGLMTDAGLTLRDRTQMRAQVDALEIFKNGAARAIRALAGEEPKSIVDENGNTGWVIP